VNDFNLTIRQPAIGDIDGLHPLMDQFVRSHPSLNFRDDYREAFGEWLSSNLDQASLRSLIAISNGQVVGFILGDIRENAPILSPRFIGHVSLLAVDHDSRQKGVGKHLWEELKSWFVSRGIDHFELFTEYGNQLSGPFWDKRGFKVVLEKRRLV